MSVIVISMVLVVVGFVTLMLGVLGVGDDPLQFVYVSIAACLVAAVFLVIGVVRGRPSKKPVVASGGDSTDASWSGASAWGDKDADEGKTAVIEREEDEEPAPAAGEPHVEVVTADDVTADGGTTGDAAFQPGDEDEPVVVPKRSAAERSAARTEAASQETAAPAEGEAAGATAAGTARKSTAKKSTARKSTAKKSTARKSTAKKATAKKSTAKKSTAKKAAARASASSGDDAARVEEKLGNVSGVGPAKRKALLAHFGSFDALSNATPAQLQEVNGVSETLAERIRRAMR